MIQRLALYSTLGVLLDALGQDFATAGFWCVLALYVCAEHIARAEAFELGVAQGMDIYRNLTAEQRTAIDTILKDTEQ